MAYFFQKKINITRKHISKAIQGNFEALKDLSRITGRKISDLKTAFEKREEALFETRSIAAKESFPSERKKNK